MLFILMFLIFTSFALLVFGAVPLAVEKASAYSQKSASKFSLKYDAVLTEEQIKRTRITMLGMPLVLAVLAMIFSSEETRGMYIVGGLVLGFLLPRIQLNQLIAKRKSRFQDQLMDALMIMSSSFRAGLSLIQAIEAVVDEMPEPIKQEFGIVLGENKMGVPLDESLNRLYNRMPSAPLQQMVTAILLARETGGNLALIFARIIASVRERRKIEMNLKTLTIQGKIQAVVMTGLPVLFYFGVSASNRHFFDILKNSPDGQKMLMVCAVLWVVGAVSIWKISTFKEL